MQRLDDGTFRFSPSDLIAWLEGDFAAWCEREKAEQRSGNGAASYRSTDPEDPELKLAARRGLEHERAHLEQLKTRYPELVEIAENAIDRAAATLAAMRAGAPIIFQGHLMAGNWAGLADFLHRIEGPSALGDWHYEPWDTKLARSAKPYFLIQLCAYAELLEALHERRPERLGFILGDGRAEHFRTDEFWHYYRRLKRQFETFQQGWNAEAVPDPGADRGHGRWSEAAQAILEARDDLSLVAGISRGHIARLRDAGIHTLTALAQTPVSQVPARFSAITFDRLREQAAMQLSSRMSGGVEWAHRVIDPKERRGLALLPPASPQDIYFDIEGFPYAVGGLEYLFGATVRTGDQLQFHDWWAHDSVQEKKAFEGFIDWAYARWQADRRMHIYHYAGYERNAISRLSIKYATREFEVDHFLKQDVMVDLLTVVRQGMVIGTPSYSLKDIEHLYMPARTGEVTSAGGSVVAYQNWIDSGEPGNWQDSPLLEQIRDYNRDDCDSTAHLAAWLRERQQSAGIEWQPIVNDAVELPLSETAPAASLAAVLTAQANLLPENSEARRVAQLLAWLLEFHRRDDKPMWWRYFERLGAEPEILKTDMDCLASLVRTATPPRKVQRSMAMEYAFDPEQDTKLHVGSKCVTTGPEQLRVTIETLDFDRGLVELKVGPKKTLPDTLCLVPDEQQDTRKLRQAILHYVTEWNAGTIISPAVDDLIHRRPPRMLGGSSSTNVIPGTGDIVVETLTAVRALDNSTLAIQGPPGTGKTTTAAKVIAALLRDGKRIGIVANSHAVVMNLLCKIADVDATLDGQQLYKVGSYDHPLIDSGRITCIETKAAVDVIASGPMVIGGTAWLFSSPELRDSLDYLFVDEAGQVSLANAVAVGTSTRNLVLMGDQMQLSQPTQGVHPGESGESCLVYLLQKHQTIPPELGIFLGVSYRMHPEVCRFISDAFYEGRLTNAPFTANNKVQLPANAKLARGTGVMFIPVMHDGNTQGSDEEVDQIEQLVIELLQGTVTIKDEPSRPMQLNDILVVAPFNMQVRALKRKLGADARVGSVDKFQGQEAPVVIVSMCASTLDDAPRGAEFLLSPNRLNVAISRAQAMAIVVGSPKLGDVRVRTVEEMKLVSGWCRIAELAE
jgi:uncharacterized protein